MPAWRWWCLELACIMRNPVIHLFTTKASMIDFIVWHNDEYHG